MVCFSCISLLMLNKTFFKSNKLLILQMHQKATSQLVSSLKSAQATSPPPLPPFGCCVNKPDFSLRSYRDPIISRSSQPLQASLSSVFISPVLTCSRLCGGGGKKDLLNLSQDTRQASIYCNRANAEEVKPLPNSWDCSKDTRAFIPYGWLLARIAGLILLLVPKCKKNEN